MPTVKTIVTPNVDRIGGEAQLGMALQQSMLADGNWARVSAAVDYSNIPEPTSAGEVVASEVYESTDAAPKIFVRISWGTPPSNASYKQARFELGTGYADSTLTGVIATIDWGVRVNGASEIIAQSMPGGVALHRPGSYGAFLSLERGRLYDGSMASGLTLFSAGSTGYGNSVGTSTSVTASIGWLAQRYIARPDGSGVTSDWGTALFWGNGTTRGSVAGYDASHTVKSGAYPIIDGKQGYHSRMFVMLPIQNVAGNSAYLIDIAGEGQKQFRTLDSGTAGAISTDILAIAHALE